MKKSFVYLTAFLGLAFVLVVTSCGGGSGGGSDNEEVMASNPMPEDSMPEDFVLVHGVTISEGINGSPVFRAGHTVTIPSFWISDHEVTQTEYRAVMGTNPSSSLSNPANGEIQANRPVEQVSWYDAIMYCNKRSLIEGKVPCYAVDGKTDTNQWNYTPHNYNSISGSITCDFNTNGYRLPTEAEWEFAARGANSSNTGQTIYSGSDTIDDVAWYTGNSERITHEVKKKLPNSIGLYDMSGNLGEFCWDSYSRSSCVVRGGSWFSNYSSDFAISSASLCSVTNRTGYEYTARDNSNGFRVVCTAR